MLPHGAPCFSLDSSVSDGGFADTQAASIHRWQAAVDYRYYYRETMLTVNAEEHPLMRRFRRPGKEKRMAVILVCASSPQRVLVLRRHSGTAAVAPARSGYPRKARGPSPQLSFHDLSPSSKLTYARR